MRLIDTVTGKFVEILDLSKIPPYAILSHTWEKLEQSYQDIVKIQEQYGLSASPRASNEGSEDGPLKQPSKTPSLALEARPRASPTPRRSIWAPTSRLSDKIRKACEVARRDGYRYIWIDSCCIDKTSSSELSEAINSMFNWYRDAQICYAFLSDVPSNQDVGARASRFRGSRWFRRGWTLQELIAPRVVVFLSEKWEPLGTRDALAGVVQKITRIDRTILTHEKAFSDESVAERMRWAAGRKTTRVEDQAYSLLGIFGINMPTLYGEGAYAFRRLQEEILQRIPDQSLFAWGSRCLPIPRNPGRITILSRPNPERVNNLSPFAPSPQSFNLSGEGRVIRASGPEFKSLGLPTEEYTPTPHGIRTQLCLLPLRAVNPDIVVTATPPDTQIESLAWHLVVLRSHEAKIQDHLLSKLCYLTSGPESDIPFLHVPEEILVPGAQEGLPNLNSSGTRSVVLAVPLDIVRAELRLKMVYLPHSQLSTPERRLDEAWDPAKLELSLPAWVGPALRLYGYTLSDIIVTPVSLGEAISAAEGPPPNVHSLTIFNASLKTQYHLQCRHIPLVYGPDHEVRVVIEARIWTRPYSDSSDSESGADESDVQDNNTVHLTQAPCASAIWADQKPWSMALPLRSVRLPVLGCESGEKTVELQLGLDLVAPGRYNIRVNVPQASGRREEEAPPVRSTRALLGDIYAINKPHTGIKLTMLGSVRRALEIQGYSVRLKHLDRLGSLPVDGSHSGCSFSLAVSSNDSTFTILIDYFHAILRKAIPIPVPQSGRSASGSRNSQQDLVIAARVALRSPRSAVTVTSSKAYQDGPYVVVWSDGLGDPRGRRAWRWCQQREQVSLTTPTGETLTLHLSLDLAWQSEYYLLVDIRRNGSSSGDPSSSLGILSDPLATTRTARVPDLLDCLDKGISLTLPGHVERGLRAQGYRVRFRRAVKDDLHSCRLALSHANFTIGIEFSNHASEDPHGNQKLTFRACVESLPSRSTRPNNAAGRATSRGDGRVDVQVQVVEWDAWHAADRPNPLKQTYRDRRGWRRWSLPLQDVTLTLPTGPKMTLRLGFYLVWPPEYCLVVEVSPHSQASNSVLGSSYAW